MEATSQTGCMGGWGGASLRGWVGRAIVAACCDSLLQIKPYDSWQACCVTKKPSCPPCCHSLPYPAVFCLPEAMLAARACTHLVASLPYPARPRPCWQASHVFMHRPPGGSAWAPPPPAPTWQYHVGTPPLRHPPGGSAWAPPPWGSARCPGRSQRRRGSRGSPACVRACGQGGGAGRGLG